MRESGSFSKTQVFAGLFFLFVLSLVVYGFVLTAELDDFTVSLITDSLVVVVAFVALLFVSKTYREIPRNALSKRVWLFLLLGVFFWFLGEFTWAVYELGFGVFNPEASLADVFWLLGYPLFLVGMVKQFQLMELAPTVTQVVLLGVAALVILFVLVSQFFVPVMEFSSEARFVENVVNFAYPAFDALFIFLALGFVFLFGQSVLGKAWSLLVASFLVSGFSDLLYFWLAWNELYFVKGGLLLSVVADLGWIVDYLLLTLASFIFLKTFKGEV